MSELKVGMIGLDTSHVSAFVKLLNNPTNEFHVPGVRIVKAFPGGSSKFSLSANRVEGFTKELKEAGIEIVDSIEALAGLDAYFLESVDGDQHLEQFKVLLNSVSLFTLTNRLPAIMLMPRRSLILPRLKMYR